MGSKHVLNGSLSLVIPRVGKLAWSNVSKNNRALCFCINKGYVESDNYKSVAYFVIGRNRTCPQWLHLVGKIDKVRLFNGSYVYRQRVFFYSFTNICELCGRLGVSVWLSKDFHISIQNVMNILEYVPALEYYARMYGESIDTYLTNTCKVQVANVLTSKNIVSGLLTEADYILTGRLGYLDKAPFILGTYNQENKSSAVFLNKCIEDKRMYTTSDMDDLSTYGFTEVMLKKDKKKIAYSKGNINEG